MSSIKEQTSGGSQPIQAKQFKVVEQDMNDTSRRSVKIEKLLAANRDSKDPKQLEK